MPSVVKFAALCGAQNDAPFCYLLDVDGYRILLDCGWQDDFSTALHEPLKRVAGSINAVLLSQPDIAHLGALPYAVAKLGLNCPVYGTLPVYNMGQMFLYDAHQAKTQRGDFAVFSLDDVDSAFDERRWHQLRYQQSAVLPPVAGKPQGITVTPFPAGRTVGGTVWRIVKDTDEIVYAVSFNHAPELHLEGSVLQAQHPEFQRPTLFITDSNCAHSPADLSRKQRDGEIFDNICRTFEQGGDVLIPIDTAGRMLEIALMLEQKWASDSKNVRRREFGICMLTYQSFDIVNFAQTMSEWMSDKIQKSIETGSNQHTFRFRHVQLCHSMAELAAVRQPRVVLASTENLSDSFALDLFLSIAPSSRNSIILTQRGHAGSLTRRLHDDRELTSVTVEHRRRVPLEGAELVDFIRKEKRRREQQLEQAAVRDASLPSMDADEDDSGAESDDDSGAAPGARTLSTGAGSNDGADGATTGDAAGGNQTVPSGALSAKGFFKHARSHPMFAYAEPKVRYDDYGEIVDPEDLHVPDTAQQDQQRQAAMDVDRPRGAPVKVQPEEPSNETPTKCVSQTVRVEIMCTIYYVDAQGLSNLTSVKNILETVQPKKIIVVNGDARSTERFKQMCKTSKVITEDVVTPRIKEIVDVSSTTDIIPVTLTDALASSLRSGTMDDYELSFVSARLQQNAQDGAFVLDAVPPSAAIDKPSHASIFIGEVMLSQFRTLLEREGFYVEIKAGVLTCDNEVSIQKTMTGRLTIEGPLSPTYFRVRELLYGQYAIV